MKLIQSGHRHWPVVLFIKQASEEEDKECEGAEKAQKQCTASDASLSGECLADEIACQTA